MRIRRKIRSKAIYLNVERTGGGESAFYIFNGDFNASTVLSIMSLRQMPSGSTRSRIADVVIASILAREQDLGYTWSRRRPWQPCDLLLLKE